MCAHSSSASDVVEKISKKLYPFIAEQFADLQEYNKTHIPCTSAALLFELVQNLKREFESLRNYEIKLVFPAVQSVFNTKDNPSFTSTVNISELQKLTQKKEAAIKDLIDDLQAEAENINLKKGHPVYAIIYVFNHSFIEDKQQWHRMLNSWNKSCACFSKANAVLNRNEDLVTHLK